MLQIAKRFDGLRFKRGHGTVNEGELGCSPCNIVEHEPLGKIGGQVFAY